MITRFKKYIQAIHLEWQKVTKPDIKEVQGSTITVIVASALLGLYIGIIDGNPAFPAWASPLSWIVLAVASNRCLSYREKLGSPLPKR